MNLFADKDDCTLLILDLQERLFPHILRGPEILDRISFISGVATLIGVPFLVTEQNPNGLGSLIPALKKVIPQDQKIYTKSAFSIFYDSPNLLGDRKTWILTGVETHICILQTAKDLILAKQHVIVLKDATSSRKDNDFLTAIGEMRDLGCRITNAETLVYEWIRDAKNPLFKNILSLVKSHA